MYVHVPIYVNKLFVHYSEVFTLYNILLVNSEYQVSCNKGLAVGWKGWN